MLLTGSTPSRPWRRLSTEPRRSCQLQYYESAAIAGPGRRRWCFRTFVALIGARTNQNVAGCLLTSN